MLESIRFLVPGTTDKFRCGGLSIELQTARLLASRYRTEIITYRQKENAHQFLDDYYIKESKGKNVLWIVSWGFDVPWLLKKLRGHWVAYHAHSSGYGFGLQAGIPILAVSRNTLGYWAHHASRNPLFLVPNAIAPEWRTRGALEDTSRRPIDVLVQKRKSSSYVLKQLIPELKKEGLNIVVQEGWTEDVIDLFNRSTVFIYDSAEYWRGRGVSEGFGLPPIEALSCGCIVFTSYNHALADLLSPGVMSEQIGCGSLESDVARIVRAVRSPAVARADIQSVKQLLEELSEVKLLERWDYAIQRIEEHWLGMTVLRHRALEMPSRIELGVKQIRQRLAKRLSRARA